MRFLSRQEIVFRLRANHFGQRHSPFDVYTSLITNTSTKNMHFSNVSTNPFIPAAECFFVFQNPSLLFLQTNVSKVSSNGGEYPFD